MILSFEEEEFERWLRAVLNMDVKHFETLQLMWRPTVVWVKRCQSVLVADLSWDAFKGPNIKP